MRPHILLSTKRPTLNLQNIFNTINEDQKSLEKLYTKQHTIRIDREQGEDHSGLYRGRTIYISIDKNEKGNYYIKNISEHNISKYKTTNMGKEHIATMRVEYNTSDETLREINDCESELRNKKISMNEYFQKEVDLLNNLPHLLEVKARNTVISKAQFRLIKALS